MWRAAHETSESQIKKKNFSMRRDVFPAPLSGLLNLLIWVKACWINYQSRRTRFSALKNVSGGKLKIKILINGSLRKKATNSLETFRRFLYNKCLLHFDALRQRWQKVRQMIWCHPRAWSRPELIIRPSEGVMEDFPSIMLQPLRTSFKSFN